MNKWVFSIIVLMLLTPFNIFSANPQRPVRPRPATGRTGKPAAATALPDTIPLTGPLTEPSAVVEDEITPIAGTDSMRITPIDTVDIVNSPDLTLLFDEDAISDTLPDQSKKVFIPNPTKAVWYSALCPGLGQIYNRRYWKLPIVIGGFMGLGYGASWNNTMLADYTRAYYDLMDNDPSTKSYMDFFPPTTTEESLNRTWLERTLKSRKDYFRRNRDLCIIGMVGVYLIAVVDAYVDASLTNFDISPDLSMQMLPALLHDNLSPYPALGLQWAFTF
ncbi:MAG: DUF5683 domain-containing protein [Bacteroides sp.]|nr:DUF5683 domain-containing protein [Bacteroides sp.]